ncbi:hypothetical protein CMQ_5612 [Grosmannia clavigera kw1407]|uniref:Uncharacterized protein n=1 Tax=Grosmannia clavigera (strain kw1407 / UAMH 11150) TaxID=655863 RepID=F0XT70_GROCL|nr:uncharacterized protein CMQ_5612 [Grosmannia clavigera kw1407]EFW99191.1 hypothetical protein CMQ_5612 [Grosmannia clavigera kw1407]
MDDIGSCCEIRVQSRLPSRLAGPADVATVANYLLHRHTVFKTLVAHRQYEHVAPQIGGQLVRKTRRLLAALKSGKSPSARSGGGPLRKFWCTIGMCAMFPGVPEANQPPQASILASSPQEDERRQRDRWPGEYNNRQQQKGRSQSSRQLENEISSTS